MAKEFNVDIEKIKNEWHPTNNGDLKFDDLATGAGKLVWWLGECGHQWEAKMFLRAVRGGGCPICSNRLLLTGFNDIASKHPEWIPYWSPSNSLPCNQVIAGGKNEYAWLCEKGHEFFSSVHHKLKGRGCPYCSNQKMLRGYNDLRTVAPELASQWHPTKNGELTPDNSLAGGKDKRWWIDEYGHEWDTTVRKRLDGGGCPACVGQKVAEGFNDLASQNPEIASEWHPTKNGDLLPSNVMVRSAMSVWWQCKNDHKWEAKVSLRTINKNRCSECPEELTVKVDNLQYINPEIAAQWHPTKNEELLPLHVTAGSSTKVWWLGECGHEWDASVYSRIKLGNDCTVCSGSRVADGVNDLATTHPEIATEFHPTLNGEITSNQIASGSNKKFWWIDENGHEWEAPIYHRAIRGYGCPICSGHKVINGVNDLLTINPELASQWHPTLNGDRTPDQVTGGGGRATAWWQCEKGHEWEAKVQGRVNGYGCPQCWAVSYISKAEQEIHDYIQSLDASLKIIQSDKKILKGKELDIYLPEKKIAIEFNGLFWHSEKAGKNSTYHHSKWKDCKEQDIQLIQIWEDEWSRNKEQIKTMIAHKMGFSTQRKVFARKTKVVTVAKAQAEIFLDTNHVQGYASGSHYVALVEKSHEGDIAADDILALLVLKTEGNVEGYVLNIIRYATSANVVGGFTKLLSYAEKTFQPDSFITFADHSVSDGGLYENNGFVADKMLPPDYMYVIKGERKHKFGYRLKRFKSDPDLEWRQGLTEKELAALNKIDRIWDAGKTRYRKIVSKPNNSK